LYNLPAPGEKRGIFLTLNSRSSTISAGRDKGANAVEGMSMKRQLAIAALIAGSLTLTLLVVSYVGWQRQLDESAKRHTQFSLRFTNAIGRVGLTKQASDIEKFVHNCEGATRDDALTAFLGVHSGGPDVPLERLIEVSRNVARLAALLDDEDLGEFGRVAGFAAMLNPKMTPDDCADVGISVYQHFQKYTQRGPSRDALRGVRRLVESKQYTFDKAMAMAMNLAKQGDDPGRLDSISKEMTAGAAPR
jgi:hypothetical protein